MNVLTEFKNLQFFFFDNNPRTKFNDVMDFDFAKALVCYERAYVEKT